MEFNAVKTYEAVKTYDKIALEFNAAQYFMNLGGLADVVDWFFFGV